MKLFRSKLMDKSNNTGLDSRQVSLTTYSNMPDTMTLTNLIHHTHKHSHIVDLPNLTLPRIFEENEAMLHTHLTMLIPFLHSHW